MKLTVANFFKWLKIGDKLHRRLRGEASLESIAEDMTERDNRKIIVEHFHRKVMYGLRG